MSLVGLARAARFRVTAPSLQWSQGGSARRISVTAGGKRVVSASGVELHPLWLRERCSSPASVQWETIQPLFQPHELACDLGIREAKLRSGGGGRAPQLHVQFSDGHTSIFDGDAIDLEAGDFAAQGVQQADISLPKVRLWDRDSAGEVQRMSFADICTGDAEPILEMTTLLLRDGQVIIKDVPCVDRELVRFAQMVHGFKGGSIVRPTNWGDVFNVRSVPDGLNKDLAYTSAALCPHVDNPYRNPNPGFQLLHVLENECSTGISLAVDGFAVAEKLRSETPEYFDILSSIDCRWENDGGDRSSALVHFAPYISVAPNSGEVTQIRYSPKSGGYAPALANPEQMQTFFAARRRLAELLNSPAFTVNFQLKAGDLWLFNNLRVLHGRTEFDPTEGRRFLQGAYIDWDGVTSAYFRAKYALASKAATSQRRRVEAMDVLTSSGGGSTNHWQQEGASSVAAVASCVAAAQ